MTKIDLSSLGLIDFDQVEALQDAGIPVIVGQKGGSTDFRIIGPKEMFANITIRELMELGAYFSVQVTEDSVILQEN